jgi:hypothetical protein
LRHNGFDAVPSRNVFPTIRKRKTTKKTERKTEDRVGSTDGPSHTIARATKGKRPYVDVWFVAGETKVFVLLFHPDRLRCFMRGEQDRQCFFFSPFLLLRLPVGFTDEPSCTIASESFRWKVKPQPKTGSQIIATWIAGRGVKPTAVNVIVRSSNRAGARQVLA